jgi:protocatechuate 4,5-dioxygenase, alpha chain
LALVKPYLDIPGTVIFDIDRVQQGYHLNQFCMPLMKPGNRERLRREERVYIDEWSWLRGYRARDVADHAWRTRSTGPHAAPLLPCAGLQYRRWSPDPAE